MVALEVDRTGVSVQFNCIAKNKLIDFMTYENELWFVSFLDRSQRSGANRAY